MIHQAADRYWEVANQSEAFDLVVQVGLSFGLTWHEV